MTGADLPGLRPVDYLAIVGILLIAFGVGSALPAGGELLAAVGSGVGSVLWLRYANKHLPQPDE